MKIITADQRLAEKSGVKMLIAGPSGVGKTSTLRTLTPEQLVSTLVVCAIYGLHSRSMIGWLNQLQHARERTVVFVAVLERHVDDLNVATWQPQLEGSKTGRELPAIVDEIITMQWINFGDGKPPARAFVCSPNPWSFPAKDRSGKLEQIEAPSLGRLLEKLTGPGQRKPFTTVSPEQHAQT